MSDFLPLVARVGDVATPHRLRRPRLTPLSDLDILSHHLGLDLLDGVGCRKVRLDGGCAYPVALFQFPCKLLDPPGPAGGEHYVVTVPGKPPSKLSANATTGACYQSHWTAFFTLFDHFQPPRRPIKVDEPAGAGIRDALAAS